MISFSKRYKNVHHNYPKAEGDDKQIDSTVNHLQNNGI